MPKQVMNVASDDYLTTVYRLDHDEGQEVFAVRLADWLGVTPPSVAGMLKRLQRDGLVSVDGRRVIHLTGKGMVRAEQMVRRHRLAECLITDVLKVAWWRAYEEAHLLEHGLSEFTEPQLFEALGRPERSPFGYPIPGSGAPEKMSTLTLADLTKGETAVIERVFEEDEQLLQFFDKEGFRPGEQVEVGAVEPYRGTVTAWLATGSTVIGTSVARRIWVAKP